MTPKIPNKGITVVEYPNYHRYRIDGRWAVGVTTALNGIPKDALKYWAAREVANYAVDNIWQVKKVIDTAGPGPAKKMLSEIPNERSSSAAARGTDIHVLGNQYIRGEEIEVADNLLPYVRGYAAYIDDWHPVSVHEELVVGNRAHMYAGRLDSIQDIPELGRCLIDYKTGRALYGEHALQCSGYRYAEFFMDGDQEVPMSMLAIERVFILHIQPDAYDLVPVIADADTFKFFLTSLQNYRQNVQSGRLSRLLGEPLSPPDKEVPQ